MSHIEAVHEDKRTDEVRLVADHADRYAALFAMSNSEGGQLLKASLETDIDNLVTKVSTQFSTLPEAELRALCAAIGVQRAMLSTLTNSKDNLDGALDTLKELTA